MQGNTPLFDLSRLNFDEFLSFFFDHDIETEEFWFQDPDLSDSYSFNDDGVAAPAVIIDHLTGLFADFANIAARFSPQQINSGIWAMFSGGGPFWLQKHLWLPSVPLPQRLGCIRSMYFVYAEYVAKSTVQVMENCFSMWWDFLAKSFWENLHFNGSVAEGDLRYLNEQQKTLLDSMFETLSRILGLPDHRSQECALHGLGHLHHPDSPVIVQHWLDKHRQELSLDAIHWVEQYRDGTVM